MHRVKRNAHSLETWKACIVHWEGNEIGEYKMDQVILDLGSDMNVLLKKTWEHMGRPALQWSPI